MSSLDRYKKRLKQTENGSIEKQYQKQYEDYLENAPNQFKYTIKKSNKSDICTMIDSNKGNEDSKSDNKYITVKHDSELVVGDNIVIDDIRCGATKYWVVNDKEILGVNSHKTFMIRPCNSFIKIKVNNVVYELPCHLINKTLYTPGVKSEENMSYSDIVINGIMSVSEDGSKLVKEDIRYIIVTNGYRKVYKITSIDSLTEGMVSFRSAASKIMEEDDLENNIAYNEEYSNVEITTEIEIVGEDTLLNQSEYRIEPNTHGHGYKFEVDKLDLVDLTNVEGHKTCILSSKNSVGWVKLSAICESSGKKFEKFIFVKGGE